MNDAVETRYFIDFDKGTLNRFTIDHDYYVDSPRDPELMENVGIMSLDQQTYAK